MELIVRGSIARLNVAVINLPLFATPVVLVGTNWLPLVGSDNVTVEIVGPVAFIALYIVSVRNNALVMQINRTIYLHPNHCRMRIRARCTSRHKPKALTAKVHKRFGRHSVRIAAGSNHIPE